MKKITDNVYTIGHSMVLIDKSYEFLSLFVKGNNSVLKGSQVKKIHIFMSNTKSLYKSLELLDEISSNAKSRIIFHVGSMEVSTRLSTFIKNNDNHTNFMYDYHRNKEPYTISDDSGKLIVFPFKVIKFDNERMLKHTKVYK